MIRQLGLTVFLTLLPIMVWADNDGPVREVTIGEREFVSRTHSSFQEALPPAPQGWELLDEDSNWNDVENVPVGMEKSPMEVVCVRRYRKIVSRESEDAVIQMAADKVQNHPDFKANEEKIKQMEALGTAMEKVDPIKNPAEFQRIQEKMEKLSEELQKMGETLNKISESETQGLEKNSRVVVQISANQCSVTLRRAIPCSIASEASLAFLESPDEKALTKEIEGSIFLFIGPWKAAPGDQETQVVLKPNLGIPHTRVQGIRIKINGSREVAEPILKGINLKTLAGLISK